jgi:hypothetical protein
MTEKIMARVRNLLRLAGDGANENEAAAAAAAAQKLIERFKLDAAMLDASAGDDQPAEEEVRDCEDPLDRSKSKIAWKGSLASGIARANSCRIYWRGGTIQLVGTPSNVSTVRYLYAYFVREIERLAKQYGGNGRSWMHAWRVGCAETLASRLKAAREEARNDARREAQDATQTADQRGVALARVNTGITRLDAQDGAVTKYMERMKLRKSRGTTVRSNGGYYQGQADGQRVNIASGGPSLGAGARGRMGA